METIYLDSAAAAPVSAETAKRFAELAASFHANPESAHAAGKRSMELLNVSAALMKKALADDSDDLEVFFTSSATEAVNCAFAFRDISRGAVVASPALHPAVGEAVARSAPRGAREPRLDSTGGIDLDDLAGKLDESVSAVVVEHVQNETGRAQDVAAIGAIVRELAPDALFVVDTVQSAGKIPIPWSAAGVNLAFVGGHKIGAPCGGALIHRFSKTERKTSAKFAEHLRRLRYSSHIASRPDPAVCAVLAETLDARSGIETENARRLSNELRAGLSELARKSRLDLKFAVPEELASPFITSFFIPPFQGEILARMLSDMGVMVSAGSACEAAGGKASGALKAMDVSNKMARTLLRVSFSPRTSSGEIKTLISALRKAIEAY